MKPEKNNTLTKAQTSFNEWCSKFNFGAMYKKYGQLRQMTKDEFDAERFKKIIQTKTWTTT